MLSFFKKKPSLEIRQLRPEHAKGCAAIHAAAFAHAWSAGEFERLLAAENVFADGAFDSRGAALYGFALSRHAADEAELLSIAIDPARQRDGFGRALLQAHLAQSERRGVRAMFLEVEESNAAAVALYRKFGFAEVGQRAGYYRKAGGGKASALIMRRQA
jgi:[ribosomal protein S18]-alanine N-acetyltransferase